MKRPKFKLLVLPAFIGLNFALNVFAQETFLSEEDFYEQEVDELSNIFDPFESVNRYSFQFNDFVYHNILQLLADRYKAVTPDSIEEGTSKFFLNLNYPVRLSSNLIQGRLREMWVETARFVINTTIGFGGLASPADNIEGLSAIKSEDLGQAFGAIGIGEGPYLVIPLLGPSNLRDLGGLIGNRAVNPIKEPFSLIDKCDWEYRLSVSGLDFINSSSGLLQQYNQLKGGAIDPYSSLKNGYTQYRRAAITE